MSWPCLTSSAISRTWKFFCSSPATHSVCGIISEACRNAAFFQADIHECRLHSRQDPAHPAFVNITDNTAPSFTFDMNFLQDATVNIGDPRLGRRDIDQ